MIEFNVDDDFIYTKLENLIPMDDPILLNHYYFIIIYFIRSLLIYNVCYFITLFYL